MPARGANIIDLKEYGRLVRAARIMAGFDRVADAIAAIEEECGYRWSERSMYALERGEVMPTIVQWQSITLTYKPPLYDGFFARAFTPYVQEKWMSYQGEYVGVIENLRRARGDA